MSLKMQMVGVFLLTFTLVYFVLPLFVRLLVMIGS